MSWDWVFPAALAVGFLLIWLVILPRLGVRT